MATAIRDLAAEALISPETYGSVLLVLVVDRLGAECLEWHPLALREEIDTMFGVTIPQPNFDRLMAAITIVTTDLFFKDAARFIQLANVLSGDTLDTNVFDPADSFECAWAITEALLLSPPSRDDPEPFSPEVCTYVAEVLKDEGYTSAPDVLAIALKADFRDKVRYDFGNDPEMFSAIASVQKDRTTDIEEMVRDGLQRLVSQLNSVPLRNGDVSKLVERMRSSLRQ